MRPSAPDVLGVVIKHFSVRMSSAPDRELAGDFAILVGGLSALAQEYDECASSRVGELEVLTDFLVRGAELSPGMFAWQDDLPRDFTADLRISALEERLDILRTRLIELQAWLEDEVDQVATELVEEILSFQEACATRRCSGRRLVPRSGD